MNLIILYLQELEIAYDLASEIIYEISKKFSFPDYLITNYIDELEDFHFSSDLQISKCNEKNRDLMITFQSVAPFFLAIDYLESSEDMCELLLVNKSFYQFLKQKIYKKSLLMENINKKTRSLLWDGKLSIDVIFSFILNNFRKQFVTIHLNTN